jgi:hypothetical protein
VQNDALLKIVQAANIRFVKGLLFLKNRGVSGPFFLFSKQGDEATLNRRPVSTPEIRMNQGCNLATIIPV